MKLPASGVQHEPRWPAALAIIAVVVLLVVLPGRIRILPGWIVCVVGAATVLPMAAVTWSSEKARWLRVETTVTLLAVALMAVTTLTGLVQLIVAMIDRSTGMGGLELLTSSVAVWVANVLMFSLLYWQVDRGGPAGAAGATARRPDLYFAQEGAPAKVRPADWRPTFPDYLFLAYSTATAFSATDVVPLTHRAKLMMMLESAVSLVTIVVVAARAINVLGS
jgi:uncharacterized membrane protein